MLLDEVTARVEISALVALYNTAGDSGRREEFSTVFTKDAVLEAPGISYSGRNAIVSGLFSGDVTIQFVRHHISTSTITMHGPESASGRSYFQVITENGLDHSGVYTDQFRRESCDWKIAHRIVSIDYVSNNSGFFPQGKTRR